MNRFFYYPYYYFPWTYWPQQTARWPEAVGQPYMRPPAYQAFPPFLEGHWRYEYWKPLTYYRGSHFDEKTQKNAHREVTCYAESTDGIHWTKPELNLFEFEGSKRNNIVWDGGGTHCFAPFLDVNPAAKPEARYKAVTRVEGGLLPLGSPDGIHWTPLADKPVITRGAFDSQNLDPSEGFSWFFDQPGTVQYVCTLHPWMTGKIIVGDGIAPPPVEDVSPPVEDAP